jgi:RNA polymerase sigma factor (TIGR02999 family)
LRHEAKGHPFEPADLVHEAFLRIARSALPVRLQSTTHLLALVTLVMRRILVDDSRSAKSARAKSVPLESDDLPTRPATDDLVIRDALSRLADCEDRLFRIVEMRFFGGFDIDEIASALDISSRTVKRGWIAARERLQEMLA